MNQTTTARGIEASSSPFEQELSLPHTSAFEIGKGLHRVFNQDTLNQRTEAPSETSISKPERSTSPSFLEKVLAWCKGTNNPKPKAEVEKFPSLPVSEIPKAISPIPVLEAPNQMTEELASLKLPAPSRTAELKEKLTSADLDEAIALMSSQSIESIMFLIFRTQIGLEKEKANVIESTYNKYVDAQQLQQKLLGDIKDILIKDERIAERFGTAQKISLLAATVAGLLSFGAPYLSPIWVTVSSVTAAAAGGLSVLTNGGEVYFQHQANEHKALHSTYNHKTKYYEERSDNFQERLMGTAEADTVFKERWAKLLRRNDKMRQLILKK